MVESRVRFQGLSEIPLSASFVGVSSFSREPSQHASLLLIHDSSRDEDEMKRDKKTRFGLRSLLTATCFSEFIFLPPPHAFANAAASEPHSARSFYLASSARACSVTSNNKQPRALRRIALQIARRLLVWQVPSLKRGRFSPEGRLIVANRRWRFPAAPIRRRRRALPSFPACALPSSARTRAGLGDRVAVAAPRREGRLNRAERGICAPKIRGYRAGK